MSSQGKYEVANEKMIDVPYADADYDGVRVKSGPSKTTFWIVIGVLSGLLVVVTLSLLGVAIALGTRNASSASSATTSPTSLPTTPPATDIPTTPPATDDVCLTEGCVQASAQIAAAMNQSVDPCDDFYQFACGNWVKTHRVEQGTGLFSSFLDTPRVANEVAFSKIFEANNDGGVEAVRKALDFYRSCMDIDAINSRGAQPLRDLINATGGWNLVGIAENEPWTINSTSFQDEKLYGSSAFFQYDVQVDPFTNNRYALYLSQSGVDGLAIAINRDRYRDFIVQVLNLISPTNDTTEYLNASNSIVTIQAAIARSFEQPDPASLNEQSNIFTIDQFQSDIFPMLDWRSLFQSYLQTADSSYTVTGEERIFVQTPNFFRGLRTLFEQNFTDPSALHHYAKWQLIANGQGGLNTYGYLEFSSDEFRQLINSFHRDTSLGPGASKDRISFCIQTVQNRLPYALARVFAEQVLPENTVETITMITDTIRDAFIERLRDNAWLDEPSRQAAIDKAEAIVEMIAYPENIFNNNYVNGLYDNLTVADDFLENQMRWYLHQDIRSDASRFLFSTVDRTTWPVVLDFAKPTDVNALYTPMFNQIVILEGILSTPDFDARWPDYINFGTIGAILGHEISHGFDNTGRNFDKDGIARQSWTNASVAAFEERLSCFIDQYSTYTIEGTPLPVNGQRTLGENIADNGAINTAFLAHKNRIRQGGTTQRLPNLNYNQDQLFFIAFSQLWCTVYAPSGVIFAALADSHSPSPIRAFAPLLNSPDFAEAFNCPVGSTMNPANRERCLLW